MAEAITHEEERPSAEPKGPVVLNGEYRFKVDSKGRVSLPAKFRKVLSTQLVVARELENECLYVFESPDFEEWINQLFISHFGKFEPSKKEHQRLLRKLKSLAMDVDVDKTGRIMLPAEAREKVGIEKDVVILGNTGRFEIWDAKRYDEDIEDIDLSVLYD